MEPGVHGEESPIAILIELKFYCTAHWLFAVCNLLENYCALCSVFLMQTWLQKLKKIKKKAKLEKSC